MRKSHYKATSNRQRWLFRCYTLFVYPTNYWIYKMSSFRSPQKLTQKQLAHLHDLPDALAPTTE